MKLLTKVYRTTSLMGLGGFCTYGLLAMFQQNFGKEYINWAGPIAVIITFIWVFGVITYLNEGRE